MAGVPQTLQIPPPVSIQTMLYNTYLQIIGGGNAPFVGPLDALVAQGASIARAWSQQRLLASYTGSADILRGDGSGSPEATINFLANGEYDLTAAEAARIAGGGTQAYRKTWFDQSGGAFDATQSVAARQPPFTTSVRAKGAIGGIASTNCDLPFTGNIAQPFFIYAIVTVSTGSSRNILGQSSGTNYLRESALGVLTTRFTNSLASSAGASAGANSISSLLNGFSSFIRVNNSIVAGPGNAGTSALSTDAKIGGGTVSANSWFALAGATISELIIFNGNPTALAGWAAFDTARRAYYA